MADMKNTKNGEEKNNKDFSEMESKTHEVFEMIKEMLQSTTEEEIEKFGFEKNEKVAGFYGDGTTYGSGVEEGQYNVIVSSRPRKFDSSKNMSHGYGNGTFEKQIFIGAKRIESQLDFEIKGKILHVQYRSPESGFFRGVDDEGGTFMVRKKITVTLKDAKKELEKELKDAAKKEVGFLTHTKLGVEDRLDASTTSIVENENMKKLTLKNLFKDELYFDKKEMNENFEELSDEEKNINAVKKLNTVELPSSNNEKFLLFDDEEQCEALIKELNLEEDEEFVEKLKTDYGVENGDVSKLTPAEKKEFFNSLKNEAEKLEEISMSGPGAVGAGGYLTRMMGVSKRKFAKGHKPEEVGKPYNVPVNDEIYETDELNESKNLSRKTFDKTPYAKAKQNRPKVDKDYNIIPETKSSNSSKPYTQVVKIDYNTHPQGMPFVKPNSKEEIERTSGFGGDYDKMERMGLKEDDSFKKSRLIKRKFISENDNKTRGINKRYIVTEKTTQEYEVERWKKLSTFNKFETIKEAEELNEVFDGIENYNDFYFEKPQQLQESYSTKNEEVEKTIEVEKPGSVFGITQKFYEKDFLNENKQFILDLNSMVFVKNPNSK
jgi:hypothetical protein